MFSAISNKRYLIALGVILIVGASGFAFYRMVYRPAHTPVDQSRPIQTAVVYRGDLVIYARGKGTLSPSRDIKLGFGTSGPLSELRVAAGSKVHAGDVLAVQGGRDRMQAAAAADQLAVMQAKRALELLNENASVVAAQAQLDLANAQDALNTAQVRWSVEQQGNRASPAMLAAADARVKLAQSDLAQAERDLGQHPHDAALQLAYANALRANDTALANWNWITGHPTKIRQAQLDAGVALAKARVAQAELVWARVKGGPDPDALAMAKQQLVLAEAQYAVSQHNLDGSLIRAPIDGTISSVTEVVGRDVSGTFITLVDLSQMQLDISMDATDLNKIGLGHEVEVTFDALPNQVFSGRVIVLQPSLSVTGPISTIKGLVQLDVGATAARKNLMLGMTAMVDVIGGRARGVLIVPVEALRKQGPGKYAVYVVEGAGQVLRPVEVGLMDSNFAEIRSGLKVGEVVSTAIVLTK